jgi:hypothetical protein
MPTILKTKNSVTTTVVPTTLQQGELAVNITDRKMWVGNAATTPVQLFGAGADGSFVNLAYTGTLTGGTGVVNLGSGQFYKDASGNIGVGTTSISGAKMDVVGGFLVSGALTTNQTDKAFIEYGSNIATLGSYGNTASSGIVRIVTGGGGGGGGQERMRITAAGDVGIGTTTALARLTSLGGSSTVTNSVSTRNPVASIRGGNDNNRLDFLVDNSGATSIMGLSAWNAAGATSAMTFYTGTTGAEAMRIDSSGNVGIGTNAPSARLHILTASDETIRLATSTTNPYLSFYESTSRRAYIQYAAGGGGLIIDSEAASAGICFNTQNSEKMRIDTAGNLIVGATSSAQKFKVYLNSSARGNLTTAGFTQDGTGDAAISFLIGATTEWLCGVDNTDSDKFKINNITGGSNFTNTGLNITTGGNVAISGSLSKGSGSFRIDHPLPQLTETHQLVHSFVEAPKADLIYRGRVTLIKGKATVNIDETATMT